MRGSSVSGGIWREVCSDGLKALDIRQAFSGRETEISFSSDVPLISKFKSSAEKAMLYI
jgi:hypothetical protein